MGVRIPLGRQLRRRPVCRRSVWDWAHGDRESVAHAAGEYLIEEIVVIDARWFFIAGRHELDGGPSIAAREHRELDVDEQMAGITSSDQQHEHDEQQRPSRP